MIDATETLYRFTAEEYEQIAEILDDNRVELIDGYLVKKMTKLPPHVLGCAGSCGHHVCRAGGMACAPRGVGSARTAFGAGT